MRASNSGSPQVPLAASGGTVAATVGGPGLRAGNPASGGAALRAGGTLRTSNGVPSDQTVKDIVALGAQVARWRSAASSRSTSSLYWAWTREVRACWSKSCLSSRSSVVSCCTASPVAATAACPCCNSRRRLPAPTSAAGCPAPIALTVPPPGSPAAAAAGGAAPRHAETPGPRRLPVRPARRARASAGPGISAPAREAVLASPSAPSSPRRHRHRLRSLRLRLHQEGRHRLSASSSISPRSSSSPPSGGSFGSSDMSFSSAGIGPPL